MRFASQIHRWVWLVFVLVSLGPVMVRAETLEVTATVVNTTPTLETNPVVQFSGLAAPNGTVIIKRGGVNIQTSSANAQAGFSVTLTSQPTGQQSYEVTGQDASGLALAPITFALNLVHSTTTAVSGVFLGPSIQLDKTSVTLGAAVTAAGATAPNSVITVVIPPTLKRYQSTAAADGTWSVTINTDDLGPGSYGATARASQPGNQLSALSATVAFAVDAADVCDDKNTADVNCDGNVDLVDFSILLFYWQETNPTNARVGINGDGRVAIEDFSIMLYQWTG